MTQKLNLVLCWHMHQPWYKECHSGEYRLPWVYLHALKDYVDMVAHLEAHPDMRVVVNFAPILLEQLDDYKEQFHQWRDNNTPFQEPLLNLLCGNTPIPDNLESRKTIILACLRANRSQMIDPYPVYQNLVNTIVDEEDHSIKEELIPYLNEQFFVDLLFWYHIAWLGHSLKQRRDVTAWMEQGSMFSPVQREAMLNLMTEQFDNLIDRYRLLAEKGQIELSMSPYSHPIVPLLIDFGSMNCAQPKAPTPVYDHYPDGEERARWQIQHGLDVFEQHFKQRPKGIWLSEGAVSAASIELLDEFDFEWTATGEGVWRHSRHLSDPDTDLRQQRHTLFHSHLLDQHKTRLFFRDDGLADLIGFEYKSWIAEDASADFVQHLHNIASFLPEPVEDHVVSVILDGENAWEYFPDNAFHFIGSLYERLATEEKVKLLTFSEATHCCPAQELPKLCPGSWVYGTFSTWIGESDKNRGWERLVEAKLCYDKVTESGVLTEEEQQQAQLQLAICEGSDWFWWFGDYNPSESVHDFDELYREQLTRLYELLKCDPPENLQRLISVGSHDAAAETGTMRRGQEH